MAWLIWPPGPASDAGGAHCQTACTVARHVAGVSRLPSPPSAALCPRAHIHETDTHSIPDVASYNNTYRNGWAAAAGAIRAAMEDARRRKGRGQLWVPTGTCGHVAIQEPIAPLTVSKHQWVFLQVGC